MEKVNNWNRPIGVYIEALEPGEQRARDAAAAELMLIAEHLNKLAVSYPDMINETPNLKE